MIDVKKIIIFMSIAFLLIAIYSVVTYNNSSTEVNAYIIGIDANLTYFKLGSQNIITIQDKDTKDISKVCAIDRNMQRFIYIKNNKAWVTLKIKGNGLSTRFSCYTGRTVTEIID